MFPAFPIYFIFRSNGDVKPWYWVGAGIALFGIVMEWVADHQLYTFIQAKIKSKKLEKQENNEDLNTFNEFLSG